MPLYVLLNARKTQVINDLRTICSNDPGLGVDMATGKVTYAKSLSSVGGNTVETIVKASTYVGIRGEDSNFPTDPGETLADIAGVAYHDQRTPPAQIDVFYDIEDCWGRGHWVQDSSASRIPHPTHVSLYHELSHAYLSITGTWSLPGGASEEIDTIKLENDYRASLGMKLRTGHGGGCNAPPPKKPPPKSARGKGCFIASAAYESETAPRVDFLRSFRDDILRQTRAGDQFFERYWEHYYRLSPLIVQAMEADPEVRELVRWSVVEPMAGYLRLLVTMPDGPIDAPEPWASWLAGLRGELEQWTAEIELPGEVSSLAPKEAGKELAILLRYVLRTSERRSAYLADLRHRGELPLRGEADELHAIAGRLRSAGLSEDEIRQIVGGSSVPTSRATYGMNKPEWRDLQYSVTVTNYTPDTFDEVVCIYKRVGQSGTVFLNDLGFNPNDSVVFRLGPCEQMESYVIGFYQGGTEVAKFPTTGNMTPQLSGQQNPTDFQPCADSWGIHP